MAESGKNYTDYITRIIREVVEIEHEKGIEIEVIRFPAQDEAGSPDVVDMVWEQIANCDLFVGDLTAVAQIGEQSISNPNVSGLCSLKNWIRSLWSLQRMRCTIS